MNLKQTAFTIAESNKKSHILKSTFQMTQEWLSFMESGVVLVLGA